MGRQRVDQTERFWAAVDKSGDCWLWKLALNNSGYGTFRAVEPVRRMVAAHRFSFELARGPIPSGMQVDHTCHQRSCVKPSHLRIVTNKQNSEHQLVESTQARSGVRGVAWNEHIKKWMAQVRHNGKLHIGGYFLTVEEAAESVQRLRNELYTHNDLDRAENGYSALGVAEVS